MGISTTLESTRGRRLDLAAPTGKVRAIFYEGHGETEVHEGLKTRCAASMQANPEHLEVLGVARLPGLSKIRPLVTRAVKAVAARHGIELFLDFDRVLEAPPISLGSRGPQVALLDARGEVRWRSGVPLLGAERARFETTLASLLRDAGATEVREPSAA